MPDAQGNYLGDRAGILPSNTEAMVHFSNEFAQMENQKRAEQDRLQRADQDRRMRLQKYLGDRLNNKDFQTGSTYNGIVESNLQQIAADANKKLIQGVPEDQIMQDIDNGARDLRVKASKVNELDKNITNSAAARLKADPTLDGAALISAARHNASYKQDKDGNWVPKDIATEVDPSQDWVGDAYTQSPELFHKAGSDAQTLKTMMDKSRLQEQPVADNPQYDKNNRLIYSGFKGKLPPFVNVIKDGNGHFVPDATGNPQVEISGAHNYKLPGSNHDFVSSTGQKVKVVPDEVYNVLPDAVKAGIEGQVKKVLETPVNFDGSGPSNFSPSSEYANMLRKNIAYQMMQGEVANRYKFTTPDDKSFQRQHSSFGEAMARARLALAQTNSGRAQAEFDWRKMNKENGGGGNAPEPLTDRYAREKGKTVTDPITGQSYKYVDVNDIDKGDLKHIVGGKYNALGQLIGEATPPIQSGDKKGYMIGDDGNWYGANGTPISREEAYKRQLDAHKSLANKTELPAEKKTIVQKIKQVFTPKKTTAKGLPIFK
jgi:hypothetical protein